MKPNFPLKNMAFHRLLNIKKTEFIKDFTEYKSGENNSPFHRGYPNQEWMEQQTKICKLSFDNMDNEINQIIHTSNSITQSAIINELKEDISSLKLYGVNKEQILRDIEIYNNKINNDFEKEVEEKTTEFHNSPERNRKHLEEYWDNVYLWGLPINGKKAKRINYNFYEIKDRADVIDISYIEDYFSFISNVIPLSKTITDKYITLYDNGLLPFQEKDKKNLFQRYAESIGEFFGGIIKAITGMWIGWFIYYYLIK
jgi:hypothetical protein